VAIVDVPTRKIEQYILVGSRPWGITFTSDEKTALIANCLSDDLSIVDMASKRVLRSVPTGRVPYTPLVNDRVGWAPVGN
jgi:YVTN family beta-propeller protein